ncbi:MAG: hypothetical protein FWE87_00925 [Coriobacteriia bacterium]|nr:hypothetical protein [Coriobacteriia bacterium]
MGKMMIIATDSIGSSNHALGTVLMTSFFMNLAEASEIPRSIHFLNEGVHLTCENSKVLDFIRCLEMRGAAITTCRTCLEYLDIEKDLRIGSVGTMFETVADLMSADDTIVIA